MTTTYEKPKVLIGIPTLNGPGRLQRCLEAIKACTDLEKFKAQILVSDDFSSPENLKLAKDICSFQQVPLLTTPVRLGVAGQWNRLTAHTHAPIIIIMNDDVEVVQDWLDALVFTLENNEHVGMVGLKAYEGITSKNPGFQHPLRASYNEARMERGYGMPSSQGHLFAFHRAKWVAIRGEKEGGFDSQFHAFYEEVDFGLELLALRWPSYMLSYPIVLHQGGATTSDPMNINAPKTLMESRAKFKAKWGGLKISRMVMMEREWPKPVEWNTMLGRWVD